MPVTATYPRLSSEWLKHEMDPQMGRKAITLVSGAGNLPTGTVLGKVTASGKYKKHVNGASDGTETAVGILLDATDASSADVRAVMVDANARIVAEFLTWDASVDNSTKKNAALASLLTKNLQQVRAY